MESLGGSGGGETLSKELRNWFAETEKVLDLYWKRKLQIERVNARLSTVQAELAAMELEMREGKMLPRITAHYGIAPRGTRRNVGIDDLMVRWENHLDKSLKSIMNKRKTYARLKARLAGLCRQQAPIEVMVKRLSKEQQRLLELRYVYRRSNYAIARELYVSETTVRRWHKQAITQCAEWLGKK